MSTKSRSHSSRRGAADRERLDSRLGAYSTLGAAALATAGASLAPDARAQVYLHTLTQFTYGSQTNTATPPDLQIAAAGSGSYGSLQFAAATAGGAVRFNGEFIGNFSHRSGRVNGALGMSGRIGSIGSTDVVAKNFRAGSTLRNGYFPGAARGCSIGKREAAGTHLHTSGYFVPVGVNAAKTGYIGFKSAVGGHTYVGWLRVKVTNHNAAGYDLPLEFTIVDKNGDGIFGAVDRIDDPNIANFVVGETAAVPELASVPAGLGLFALGAAGVVEFRRRRRAAKDAAIGDRS